MKTFKLFMLAFMALSLFSCGEKKSGDSIEVSVDNTTIGGKLSSYFTLVDKTYKYKKGIVDEVNVELKCIEPLPENLKAYIAVEVLDEDGNVISARKADAWSFSDYDVLRQASSGQTVTIKIENHENVGDETPAKIRLSSIIEEDDESKSESKDESSEVEEVKPSLEVILPSSLKGKVEIAFCGEVTESSYGYPEVEIGFKLLETVNTSSLVSSYGQMWIVGVGQDENGRDVKELLPNYGEWRSGDSDGKEFKEFLESEPGETINLTFTGGKEGDVSEGIEKVAKFKLKITN
jgi:hypothetical protein